MTTGSGTVNSSGQFVDSYWDDVEGIANPACTYEGEQSYVLSTASFLTVHRQRWRFDTTGIHRQ